MPWARILGRTAVPVLLYHQLGAGGVGRQAFREQMRWLAEAGVRTLRPGELARVLAGEPLDRPAALVTFDDGFRDLYTFALPVLAGLGLCATVFAITGRLRPDAEAGQDGEIAAGEAMRGFLLRGDRSAWLSAGELREMADSGVFSVGSHTASHAMVPVSGPELSVLPEHWAYAPWQGGPGPYPRLAPELAGPAWLAEQGRAETEAEFGERAGRVLAESRAGLEAVLDRPAATLAWPWGAFHPQAKAAAQRAGFSLAFTTARGPAGAGTDPLAVPRLEVRKNQGMSWFASRMAAYSRAWTARLYSGMRV
ncbi:MAG: polysaccharide deacetylase family protein [Thermodesulfobacteriota bacterium]